MEQTARDGQARLGELTTAPGSPERWEAEHPRASEELREAEQALDRAVEQEASARIESPAEHITRVLGPRPEPAREAEAAAWNMAAHAIERQGYGSHEQRFARVEGLLPTRDRERALDRGHGFEL